MFGILSTLSILALSSGPPSAQSTMLELLSLLNCQIGTQYGKLSLPFLTASVIICGKGLDSSKYESKTFPPYLDLCRHMLPVLVHVVIYLYNNKPIAGCGDVIKQADTAGGLRDAINKVGTAGGLRDVINKVGTAGGFIKITLGLRRRARMAKVHMA